MHAQKNHYMNFNRARQSKTNWLVGYICTLSNLSCSCNTGFINPVYIEVLVRPVHIFWKQFKYRAQPITLAVRSILSSGSIPTTYQSTFLSTPFDSGLVSRVGLAPSSVLHQTNITPRVIFTSSEGAVSRMSWTTTTRTGSLTFGHPYSVIV